MMKYINVILILIVIFILGLIFYNKFIRFTNEIPIFCYTNVKNNLPFTNNDIPKSKETIIVYVSTACGSCETTINNINKNLNRNTTYIIITSEKDTQTSKSFFKKLLLNDEIILLNDLDNNFTKDFKLGFSIIYPTIFTFTQENKLIKVSNNF